VLAGALEDEVRVGMPWLSLLVFIRIATHPSVFPKPLSTEEALAVVDAWCARPNVVHPEPPGRFASTFSRTLIAGGAGGNLVNDAQLAALAIEYGATVVTVGCDFSRFSDVEAQSPFGSGR
jgi:uncharacterized protein